MRIEDALLIKTRPKFGSKRWDDLRRICFENGYPSGMKCDRCGRVLLNPLSIIIHQGKVCEGKKNS